MNEIVLAWIASKFKALGIDYSFMRKNGKVKYPYFVGEYQESPEPDEDGRMPVTFFLNGWTTGSWLDLINVQNALAVDLREVTEIVEGYGVALCYANSVPIAQEDAELKRIQITFNLQIWRNE